MARHDQTITQDRVDELNSIRGFFTPIFTREDPVTGERHHLLDDHAYHAILAGYGCPSCLADFGIVRLACPVCHEPVEISVAPARDEWRQHLSDRESGYAPPVRYATADDLIADVMADPDIEQRKL